MGFKQALNACEVASDLARQAGALIMGLYRQDYSIQYKNNNRNDPVTTADKQANALIVEGLQRAFPEDAILAEESQDDLARQKSRRLWCVDPVDGTQEFIAKNGEFAVMIGLAIDGEARLGVVYQPTVDQLYVGFDQTAYVENAGIKKPLVLSNIEDARHARMMVSRSHPSKRVTAVGERLGLQTSIPHGSIGLKLAVMARGDAELYLSYSEYIHEWDTCGPEAILRACGGLVTDVHGDPLRYNKTLPVTTHGFVCSNGLLHAQILAAL